MNATYSTHWLSRACLLLAVAWSACTSIRAADSNPPERMTYQGFLTDGNGDPLGEPDPKNYDAIFRIYDDQTASSSGNRLWSEQQTVTVDKGYFSVLLGEGSQFGSEPYPSLSSLFATPGASERYLEITVRGIGAGSPPADVTIAPRLRLLTSPYAFLARRAVTAGALVNSPSGQQVVSITTTNVGINQLNPTSALDVNGVVTSQGLKVNGGAQVSGTVSANSFSGNGTIPIGGIIMWSGSAVPPGWALCDGKTVNGTKTPDLRGRFVLSSGDGSGLTSRSVGQTGGFETHTLTQAEMPVHAHAIVANTVGYSASWNGSAEATGAPQQGRNNGTQSRNSNTAGSGQAHNNMPPYYVLAFIMRVQ